MSITRLPGFGGMASLYRSGYRYVSGLHYGDNRTIYPTSHIDQACLGRCMKDCGRECAGTSGSGKSQCILECAKDNSQCNSLCTRPGDPSQASQPPSETCSVSDTRRCTLFGIPFLPVPLGTPGAVCTGNCTKTCCSTQGDQRLCAVSSC